ncbi:MAG TPA: ECF-type sigma factor [Vicinamibacteria bacterium]|nr:ECF-type sigma factor [Vicinamibacteria bacterium]
MRSCGAGLRVTLAEAQAASPRAQPDLIDLDHALDELAAIDERQAHLVELRFFGGLSIEESARP